MTIRELRLNAKMTQVELAKRLSIAPNSLSQYEKGTRRLDTEVAKKIADIFGVSLDEIYGYRAPAKEKTVTDTDIKFALFGDAPVTDADLEDVKRYAEFIKKKKGLE